MRKQRKTRMLEEIHHQMECRDLARTKDVPLLRALQQRVHDTIALSGVIGDDTYIRYCQYRLRIVNMGLEKYDREQTTTAVDLAEK